MLNTAKGIFISGLTRQSGATLRLNPKSSKIGSEIYSFFDTILIIGESFIPSYTLHQTNVTYLWSPADLFSCADCPFPELNEITEDVTVTLTVSDSLGCFEISNSIEITVEEKYSVSLPQTFSPNGDGNNDRIYVRGWGIESLLSFEIYNRWGVKVYSVSGYGQNGRYFIGISNGRGVISQSSLLPTGTYFYILKYKSSSGDFKERKGYLYLTR